MSMKIDRIKDDKISWSEMYGDPGTAQYHTLEDEVNYAVRCRVTTLLFFIQHTFTRWFSRNLASLNTSLRLNHHIM